MDARIRTAFLYYFQDWSGLELSIAHAVEVTGATHAYVRALVKREGLDAYS
jgi:hypothetical protein